MVNVIQDPKTVHKVYKDLGKIYEWSQDLSPGCEVVSATETMNMADPDHEDIQPGFHVVQFEALKSKTLRSLLNGTLILTQNYAHTARHWTISMVETCTICQRCRVTSTRNLYDLDKLP